MCDAALAAALLSASLQWPLCPLSVMRLPLRGGSSCMVISFFSFVIQYTHTCMCRHENGPGRDRTGQKHCLWFMSYFSLKSPLQRCSDCKWATDDMWCNKLHSLTWDNMIPPCIFHIKGPALHVMCGKVLGVRWNGTHPLTLKPLILQTRLQLLVWFCGLSRLVVLRTLLPGSLVRALFYTEMLQMDCCKPHQRLYSHILWYDGDNITFKIYVSQVYSFLFLQPASQRLEGAHGKVTITANFWQILITKETTSTEVFLQLIVKVSLPYIFVSKIYDQKSSTKCICLPTETATITKNRSTTVKEEVS